MCEEHMLGACAKCIVNIIIPSDKLYSYYKCCIIIKILKVIFYFVTDALSRLILNILNEMYISNLKRAL